MYEFEDIDKPKLSPSFSDDIILPGLLSITS